MKLNSLILAVLSIALVISCTEKPKPSQKQIIIHTHKEYDSTRNAESREDSIEMAQALSENSKIPHIIWATTETDAVESEIGEDAADDPAIWVNPNDPLESLVLGTQKKSGLYAYDLEGKTKQFIPAGNINNVDLRPGFTYRGREVALVAGSNRSLNAITFFYIDPESAVLSDTIANITATVDEVYGICMYHSHVDSNFYVFVNGKGGKVEQWLITSEKENIIGQLVRELYVGSQPEGMVANDHTGIVYLGVEEEGIAKLYAEPGRGNDLAWLEGSTTENQMIRYDIEGLSIYDDGGKSYLVASSQGNFSYAIWEIGEKDSYVTSFAIWELQVDGVEETDGLDITSMPLGEKYPKGLLVVQDGFNYEGESLVNQNFKYVSWEKVQGFLH